MVTACLIFHVPILMKRCKEQITRLQLFGIETHYCCAIRVAQRNVLADYGELYQLRNDVKSLTENNDNLKSTLETILDQLANPSLRAKIFTIADALIGGNHVVVSSGGGDSSSGLRWNGRRPDEEEYVYRRRCLLHASRVVKSVKSGYRRK